MAARRLFGTTLRPFDEKAFLIYRQRLLLLLLHFTILESPFNCDAFTPHFYFSLHTSMRDYVITAIVRFLSSSILLTPISPQTFHNANTFRPPFFRHFIILTAAPAAGFLYDAAATPMPLRRGRF